MKGTLTMSPAEKLEWAIERFENYKSHEGSPKYGPVVVAAYKASKIQSLEDALYVMAFMLEASE